MRQPGVRRAGAWVHLGEVVASVERATDRLQKLVRGQVPPRENNTELFKYSGVDPPDPCAGQIGDYRIDRPPLELKSCL